MTQPAPGAPAGESDPVPQVPGLFVLPNGSGAIDVAGRPAARLRERSFRGIIAETITGGVPDACDQLPEGTIIVSP